VSTPAISLTHPSSFDAPLAPHCVGVVLLDAWPALRSRVSGFFNYLGSLTDRVVVLDGTHVQLASGKASCTLATSLEQQSTRADFGEIFAHNG
jgi:hypothetical protein